MCQSNMIKILCSTASTRSFSLRDFPRAPVAKFHSESSISVDSCRKSPVHTALHADS